MKKRYKLLLWLLLIFITSELILRAGFGETLKTMKEPAVYREHNVFGFTPVPGADGEKSVRGIHEFFKLNDNGFIGPFLTKQKSKEQYRIIVVGFSNTEGYFVDEKQNALYQLSEQLKKNGYQAEVINCSIGGGYYRKLQQYMFLKEWVSQYEADLILFETGLPFIDYYVSRDVYRGFPVQYETGSPASKQEAEEIVDKIRGHAWLTSIYDASYTVRAAARLYLKMVKRKEGTSFARWLSAYARGEVKFDPGHTRHNRLTVAESIALLKHADSLFTSKSEKIAYFQIPEKNGIKRSLAFYDTLAKYNLPSVNVFTKYTTPDSLYYDNGHLNQRGHRLLADSLFRSLQRGNYISAASQQ